MRFFECMTLNQANGIEIKITATNFFEKRVSEYQRPTDRALSFDDAF